MTVRAWLHRSVWRPLTIAFVGAMLLIGGALDYAAAQREGQCRSNNRTTALVKSLIEVTFDDGTPDPSVPLTAEQQRAVLQQRLANSDVYADLDADDQHDVVSFILVLSDVSTGNGSNNTETRLRALANSLTLDDCEGALIF